MNRAYVGTVAATAGVAAVVLLTLWRGDTDDWWLAYLATGVASGFVLGGCTRNLRIPRPEATGAILFLLVIASAILAYAEVAWLADFDMIEMSGCGGWGDLLAIVAFIVALVPIGAAVSIALLRRGPSAY